MTTNAPIDPATLHLEATQTEGIPSLGVKPASNNPFVGEPVGHKEPAVPVIPVVAAAPATTGSTKTTGTAASPVHPPQSGSTSTSASKPSTGTQSTGAQSTGARSTDSHSTSAHSTSTDGPTATGLRQRVNSLSHQLDHATEHPVVQNAKGTAQKQIAQLREQLGRSQTIRDLEKRFNIDRVYLVVGGVLAYLLLIPLNLFGLALPTTTLLTLLPPSFLALGLLEANVSSEQNEAATRALLAYFVTLGFIQFLESLAAGVLEKRIPQYYTLKLLVLAYLLHPRTQGAMHLHRNVYRPLFVHAQAATSPVNTPPQSKEAGFNVSSPSTATKPLSASSTSTFDAPSTGASGLTSGFTSAKHGEPATGPTTGGSIGSSGIYASDAEGNVTKTGLKGGDVPIVGLT